MNKDYKISADGTIFEIMEDGSISKIASIDENGNVSTISGTINKKEQSNTGIYWFFIILFLIISIVLGILYAKVYANYSRVTYEIGNYREKHENASLTISSLRSENNLLKQDMTKFKNKVINAYPLIITDVEIANIYYNGDIHTDYGSSLYENSTMYLKPRIKYMGFTSGYKEFKIKWYNPDGTIRRGDSSPYGFSQSESIYLSIGDNNSYELSGWGNSYKGAWASGTYRIEIWYEDMCLKSKTFIIY